MRIFLGGLERLTLEQEMDSLEHSLRQPDFENKERSRGWGLEVVSAVFQDGQALGIVYLLKE